MRSFIPLPAGWFDAKVGYEYEVTLGKMIQSSPKGDADIPCCYHKSATIQDGQLLLPATGMFASKEEINNLRIQTGDLLVCEGGDIGRAALVEITPEKPVIIQNSAHRVRPLGAYPTKWLYYVLKFYKYSGLLNVEITGTSTISHFTNEIFKSMVIPFPPVDIVNKLICILDSKIKKVDEIIAKRKHQLNALAAYRESLINKTVTKGLDPNVEMKDSGVEWLGFIPAQWHIRKVRGLVDVITGYPFESQLYQTSGDFRLLRGINISPDKTKWDDTVFFSIKNNDTQILKKFILEKGDVLIGMDRTWIKNGARVATVSESDLPSLLVQRVARLRSNGKANVQYLKYLFQLKGFELFSSDGETRISVPHISQDQIDNYPIPIPPLETQHEIVDFLDQKIKTVNKLSELMARSITLLDEYRSSLISAAVTGKLNIEEGTHGE